MFDQSFPLSHPLSQPGRIHPGLWRADQLATPDTAVVSSGYPSLDAVLPGQGWPIGTLTEWLMPQWGIGEMHLLACALRACQRLDGLSASTRAFTPQEVVLIAPPYLPYAPALQQAGLVLSQLTMVRPARPLDGLWAAEQALKSGACGGVILWCDPVAQPALRRLHLAAQTSPALMWIWRPIRCLAQSSPAPLRLTLHPMAGRRVRVDIPKRRGPVLQRPIVLDLPRPYSGGKPEPSKIPSGSSESCNVAAQDVFSH